MSRKLFCETLLVTAVTFVAGTMTEGLAEGISETKHFVATELYLRKDCLGKDMFSPTEELVLRRIAGKTKQ